MYRFRIAAGVIVAALMTWAVLASAQVPGADNESESDQSPAAEVEAGSDVSEEQFEDQVMDEIEVVVGPQGQTTYELEMERVELMRETLYNDIRMRERAEEELAWRQADPDLQNPESRIKWGYSPQAEQRMRRENDYIYDSGIDQVKPASLFRVEF